MCHNRQQLSGPDGLAGLSLMSFTQFVEIGRLVLISFGPLADKLAVIVDIVDDKRVLVDIIGSEDARQVIPVRRFRLTDFVTKFERGAAPKDVAAAVKSEGIVEKFQQTKWGKRVAAAQAKANLNDFQRFKWAKLAAKRDELVKAELSKK